MLDDAPGGPVGVVVVCAAVFVGLAQAGATDLGVKDFVAEALECG